MSKDFAKKGIINEQLLINSILFQIKIILKQYHRKLKELNILVNDDDLRKIELLNENQRKIFDEI
ncbi:2646_t:CDS:2, partial [Scutellospora calospora]